MTYTCDSSTWEMKTRTESVQSLPQSPSDFEDRLSYMGLNVKTNKQTKIKSIVNIAIEVKPTSILRQGPSSK